MKNITAALFAILFALPADAKEVTKKTQIALNWKNMEKTGYQTENMVAPFPGGSVSFTRDVEGFSTDEFTLVHNTGAFCSAMVASADSVNLKCGSLDHFYMLLRVVGEQGIQLFLFTTETVPDDPPPPAKQNPTKKVPPIGQPWIKRT